MKFTTLLSGFFMLAFGMACSPRSGDPVHITLPDGYEGVFKIVADPGNGLSIEKDNDQFRFTIPDDGILRIESIAPFRHFHETTVTYTSGGTLPNGLITLPGKTLAYYYLWSDTNEAIWFLIGTHDEYEAVQQAGSVRVGANFLGDRKENAASEKN